MLGEVPGYENDCDFRAPGLKTRRSRDVLQADTTTGDQLALSTVSIVPRKSRSRTQTFMAGEALELRGEVRLVPWLAARWRSSRP